MVLNVKFEYSNGPIFLLSRVQTFLKLKTHKPGSMQRRKA